jgi:hypothetical protein
MCADPWPPQSLPGQSTGKPLVKKAASIQGLPESNQPCCHPQLKRARVMGNALMRQKG